jgi:hypothetical protein
MEDILKTKLEKINKLILLNLHSHPYAEFTKKDERIKKDITLLINIREYLDIKKEGETYLRWFDKIKERLMVIENAG